MRKVFKQQFIKAEINNFDEVFRNASKRKIIAAKFNHSLGYSYIAISTQLAKEGPQRLLKLLEDYLDMYRSNMLSQEIISNKD